MKKHSYYNDVNEDCCEWLRDLIKAKQIPDGYVDNRSITDVRPEDLREFRQVHMFCGIGLWPLALRLSGFPDEPLWTGSCPCQPFSSAGKGKGEEDERHLWPVWNRLIEECRPPIVVGEQVAAAIRKGWLDTVQGDLEAQGYAVGKIVLGAHSVGGPHIRQRLFFVADSERWATERRGLDLGDSAGIFEGAAQERERVWPDPGSGHDAGLLDNPSEIGRESESVLKRGAGAGVQPPEQKQFGGTGSASLPAVGHGADGSISGLEGRVCGEGVRPEAVPEFGRLLPLGVGLADAKHPERWPKCEINTETHRRDGLGGGSDLGGVALDECDGLCGAGEDATHPGRNGADGGVFERSGKRLRMSGVALGDTDDTRLEKRVSDRGLQPEALEPQKREAVGGGNYVDGFWRDSSWVWCRDQKFRPVEPSTFPLAHGLPRSMGSMPADLRGLAEVAGLSDTSLKRAKHFRKSALQGYGNAIVPPVAVEFLKAYLEARFQLVESEK